MKTLRAVFCADRQNDLIRALRESGYEPKLAENAGEAVSLAGEGEAVFLLADGYPVRGTVLTPELLDAARAKALRLYIEYPEEIGGVQTGEPQTILFERIVAPDGFMGAMEPASLLMINGCWYRRWCEKRRGLLCLAKAAGYDTAVYGLPEEYEVMLDWLDGKKDVLVAASALSRFIAGRYAPTQRWRALWQKVLEIMGLGEISLTWTPDVTIEAGREEAMGEEARRPAYERAVSWMYNYMITRASPDVSVLEGYESAMDCTGKQFARYIVRADCLGETAMEMACGWRQTGNPDYRKTAVGLIEHTLKDGAF